MLIQKPRKLARRQKKGAARVPFFLPAFLRAQTLSGSRALVRLPSIISALLVMLMASTAANLLWMWADFSDGQNTAGRRPLPAQGASVKTDFSVLSAFDPFHRAAPAAADVAAKTAPVTSLDLQLFGVRAGENGEGSAIVRTPDKNQGVFRVGDAIMPGVTLRAVMADRIVLSHQGNTESLYLDPDARGHQTIAEASAPSQPVEAAGLEAQKLDFQTVLNAVRLSPRVVDGVVRGFSINPGADAEAFRRSGLEPGDVLLAVNGTALDTAERMAALETSLRGARSVRLEVERGGARKIIEISNAL
ncbi:type II secretion system protein GspC [Pedomonas mirosovicensis]|uniref:type II secretion system protein GspC n=1 Tax=Pedomonas mirosovicensis TaxID=2908641 RepID=UPI002167082C|nr:type II secretion system protein GspC [Pedomonas mirosovicensis]